MGNRKDPGIPYGETNRSQFLSIAECLIPPEDMRYVRAAYQLSKGAHRNQKRDGGRRYFDHPREVALILMKELKIGDWKVIVLGLLYDTLEDSFLMSPWVLEKIFGADVA